ncbi:MULTISPECIES: phasin family protein [Denitromonas]|nr:MULTISPECIES: phasin family protein [Denitromonas]TVO68036.1 phasin family protein [Denitromonas ohlonensis]TVO78059.1 phasin family protein [Denitromonas ohlonensis]TVT45336.1 MAG: phasin family protein [Denitromonas halophila]TVT69882.1 MAG: phasin family protein [Denitromonas halophila]TVT78489.1 MAG: phasin family protein [Denitromonas halophila]
MMTKDTLIASHADALDTLSALVGIGFDTIERSGTLSLDFGRAGLEDGFKLASDLAAVREPKALLALGASAVAPALSRSVGYLRTSYAIASEAGESINAVLAPKYASINKDLDKAIDALSVSTPVGGEVIAKALKSAMSATNSAIEDAAKTTRKVVEMTESNINKATDAAVKSATKAAKKVA